MAIIGSGLNWRRSIAWSLGRTGAGVQIKMSLRLWRDGNGTVSFTSSLSSLPFGSYRRCDSGDPSRTNLCGESAEVSCRKTARRQVSRLAGSRSPAQFESRARSRFDVNKLVAANSAVASTVTCGLRRTDRQPDRALERSRDRDRHSRERHGHKVNNLVGEHLRFAENTHSSVGDFYLRLLVP